LATVAEKESVLPSNTVPELGAMVTVICGGGGVVEPLPPPLAQPEMATPRARRRIVRAVRRWTKRLRVEELCSKRDCERGRMVFAIADEGPEKKLGGLKRAAERSAKLCCF